MILLPVRMIFTYIMLYYILPHFLVKQRYKAFILSSLIHAFLFGTILWMHFYYLLNFPDYNCCYKYYPLVNIPKILVNIITNYGITLIAVVIKLFKWWYLEQLSKSRLEKEKLASELNYLKSQIHPHFLFNTLNNLYSLTLKKSEKASDVVIKLSNLLDYMLYHSGAEQIPIEKEIEIIKSYIELEKIRYDERLDLKLELMGDTSSVSIAPLILFPFIENAFKHGASNDSKNPYITVSVKIEGKILILNVVNSVPLIKATEKSSEGIGLNNVQRRLELIYPNQHKLILTPSEHKFSVSLTLNLS